MMTGGRHIYDVTLVGSLVREDTTPNKVKRYRPCVEGELANLGITLLEVSDETFTPLPDDEAEDWTGRKLDPTYRCTIAIAGAAYVHNHHRAFRELKRRFDQTAKDAVCELGEVVWDR